MELKKLYKEYFQKSRAFLYPALDIKRGTSVVPIETYVSWSRHVTPESRKLICLYHLREDKEYIDFEKQKLLGNPLFEDFREVEDGKAVYVFNFDKKYQEDFDHFLNGKYSRISSELKKKIRGFYGTNSSNYVYIQSYLNPKMYYSIYAELLAEGKDVEKMEQNLRQVGQLCSKPDLEKETLELLIKDLEIKHLIT